MLDYNNWSKDDLIEEIEKYSQDKQVEYQSLNILEAIHDAQTDFINVDAESNIFNKILNNILKVTNSEYGFIYELLYDADKKPYLETRAITNIAWDDQSRAIYKKLLSGEFKFNNLDSIYGEVMKTGRAYISNNAPADPKGAGVPKGHPALNKFLGIPLYIGSEFIGVVGLANTPKGYSENIINNIAPLTKICSIILMSFRINRKNREMVDEVLQKNQELNTAKALADLHVKEINKVNSELEQYTYIVSHDLQVPLVSISGFLGKIINYRKDIDENETRYFNRVKANVTKMEELLKDLLELSRVQRSELKLDPNNIIDILHEIKDSIIPMLEKHGIKLKYPNSAPNVLCNKNRIFQVLSNLINNSILYMGEQSKPKIEVGFINQTEADVDWYVKDNGQGIAQEYHEKIFKIFERLNPDKADGTGLGLCICKNIIEKHGSKIRLESSPGKGAVFSFNLAISN